MKPSEMTNERIAEELIATIPILSDEAWSCTDADDILREAAARLRKIDITIVEKKAKAASEGYAHGCEEVADLRRRLKVAEDALDKVYKCIDNRYGVDASLLAKKIIADALAAIRNEAEAKQPVTDCNHLGNAEKMREALEFAEDEFWSHGLFDASKRIASAISAPPRNCDRFSNANEALEAFEKETGETMIEFIRWLFAEERGGAK